jgi:hypothetical protein
MPLANRSLKPVPPQLSLPTVPTQSKHEESHPSTTSPVEASKMTELYTLSNFSQNGALQMMQLCRPESSSNQPYRAAETPISCSNEEEEEYVQLTRDLASQLSPTDRLQVLLGEWRFFPFTFSSEQFCFQPKTRRSNQLTLLEDSSKCGLCQDCRPEPRRRSHPSPPVRSSLCFPPNTTNRTRKTAVLIKISFWD